MLPEWFLWLLVNAENILKSLVFMALVIGVAVILNWRKS
jgi:hypothetical protein